MQKLINALCLSIALLADLVGQNPEPVINYGAGIRTYQATIGFSDQDVERWQMAQPNHIDAFSADLQLQLAERGEDGMAEIEVRIPQSGSWSMLFKSSTFPTKKRVICRDPQSNEILWSLTPCPSNNGQCMSPFISADHFILQIEGTPTDLEGGTFDLATRLYVSPKDPGSDTRGFGNSLECEQNLHCQMDSLWHEKGRSTVRIRIIHEEVAGWCSGVLLNNTANDGRPYIYSAEHCIGNYTPLYDQWRFDFLYQASQCEDPSAEPEVLSMTGCELRAKGRDSDFLLVELKSAIPAQFEAFYSGWNREEDFRPDTAYLLHHPQADIKKISADLDEVKLFPFDLDWTEGYTTPENSHYRLVFDLGGFEPGSSGGPVFDPAGKVIGSLHGGVAGCEDDNLCYAGSVVYSWDAGETPAERLRDWLDPLGTGPITLEGIENPDTLTNLRVRGQVLDPNGQAMPGVALTLSGVVELTAMTDSEGMFIFEPAPPEGTYTVRPAKDTFPKNGVSGLDMVKMLKHLIGAEPFEQSYQFIAADANHSETVTAVDMVIIQKLILGKITEFPMRPSWVFDPGFTEIEGHEEEVFIEFMGIKVGDVNGSADPAQ